MPRLAWLAVVLVSGLALPALASGDPAPAGFAASAWVDTSACPGLAGQGASGLEASGTLSVNQRNAAQGAFDLHSSFHGDASGSTETFSVNFSGSIKGAPSGDVLGVGTLIVSGHGHGMVVHNVALIAFGPLSFDVADAGDVQCVGRPS